jgi:Integrase core domain
MPTRSAVGTVRQELLDRTLIWNHQQLGRLLREYVEHYNSHRPHRTLGQRAPDSPDVDAYRPVSRSGGTQPVADSSTNTAKQPDSPRHRPTHRQRVRFDAPAPPPHAPTPTSRKFTEHPNAFPAPTGCALILLETHRYLERLAAAVDQVTTV